MKTYDVTCPICGTINHNLYLEETHGWMECENCGSVVSFGDPVTKQCKDINVAILRHKQIDYKIAC